MKYNFDTFPDRRSTDSVKWRAYGENILPMWVADMDFVSPEPVLQALHARVEHGVFGYPEGVTGSPKELKDLRQIIIDRLLALYNWQVDPTDLIFIPGIVTGINLACHTLAKPGGKVIVETPVYPPFLHAAQHAEMERLDVELVRGPDDRYTVDWQAFEKACSQDSAQLFILCNPHNPVGRVFTRRELERMAEHCLHNDVTICSDEIHCDLLYNGHKHIPVASIDPEIAQKTITLMAPTKTFNIAGLEFSAVIIQNRELREKYRSSTKGLVGWVNIMGLTAAKAAFSHGQEWLDQLLVYLEGNRDYLYQFVQSELPGVEMGLPEGTYLAWLDCREANLEGGPYQFFLKNAGVAFNDGVTFGAGGDGFVRLNFGCPRSMLEEALGRVKQALSGR